MTETQTVDLAAWLTRIWDEEERRLSDPTFCSSPWPTTAQMLARIAADRKILELHHPDRVLENWYWPERRCAECGQGWHGMTPIETPPTVIGPERGCATVRLLASPYKRREGWQEEWGV